MTNLNSGLQIIHSAKFEFDQVITLKVIQVFVFIPKVMCHIENKMLLWQHLIEIFFDEICKMTVKCVKLKSESFFQYLMAFWSYEGKLAKRRIPPLPPPPPPVWIQLKGRRIFTIVLSPAGFPYFCDTFCPALQLKFGVPAAAVSFAIWRRI